MKKKLTDEERLNKLQEKILFDYHLCVEYKNDDSISWAFFKKYNDYNIYYSMDNRPLLSSEKNTIDELEKYIKDHKKIKLYPTLFIPYLVFFTIMIIIMIVSGRIEDKCLAEFLSGVHSGITYTNIAYLWITFYIHMHNNGIDRKEKSESWRRYFEKKKKSRKSN